MTPSPQGSSPGSFCLTAGRARPERSALAAAPGPRLTDRPGSAGGRTQVFTSRPCVSSEASAKGTARPAGPREVLDGLRRRARPLHWLPPASSRPVPTDLRRCRARPCDTPRVHRAQPPACQRSSARPRPASRVTAQPCHSTARSPHSRVTAQPGHVTAPLRNGPAGAHRACAGSAPGDRDGAREGLSARRPCRGGPRAA